jgi:serine/threonine protein kinase
LGFNEAGQIKLFDFGLAKRLDPSIETDNDLYLLTGNTGSLRYMAPEVAIGLPYVSWSEVKRDDVVAIAEKSVN